MTIRLKELVESLGGQLIGDADTQVSGIAPLSDASASQITFLSNPKFRPQVSQTQAAAIILSAADDAVVGADFHGVRIVAANPYAYFARAAQFFAVKNAIPVVPGIHPAANVDPAAHIAETAYIGANAVIGAGASIGEHVRIGAGCVIGRDVSIGAESCLYPNVIIYDACQIGQRAIIHSGVVIGADGFGFANDGGTWVKIPQTGRVLIGDDVEIGANTTIDRGALADTVIEEGVKLDNQIQIAHNCHIGAHTAIAACAGIAGSARIGKYCSIGGAAMIHGHITIVDHVHVSAGTLALRSISEPGQYTGFYPIAKHGDWEKSAALVRNLNTMREKIRSLEKSVKQLSQQSTQEDNE
ncbi:UDP-3-O-[3-hydroxymyristoyl] glucosamine N-acyltransferase [Collimonas sp. OK307]|uniref:UDP-3-O-(3-hydroxymyristoyl)glucosamine N-acyltransferase n=1 Tax=Collimonas sp. OK307 TaxID=1801620 RepID=UPI0008F37B92|nr:UDP-3-O-(3-hydroxymyristoyl)glucosamine N-acyltransferase [Collimonas sp. OK307]SFI39583.1 UDP-3-O-[3-hydroxymyristoyl] glucosamine N-acyltransferase [Collimonas sp. OK307]